MVSAIWYKVNNFKNIFKKIIEKKNTLNSILTVRGSRSTFEFPSRVNLSVPFVLYLALWTGLAGATWLTRSDFMLHIG